MEKNKIDLSEDAFKQYFISYKEYLQLFSYFSVGDKIVKNKTKNMEIKLTINNKEVKLSKETIDSIKNIVEEERGYKVGDKYYCIENSSHIYISSHIWRNSDFDNSKYKLGECLKTEELAEKELDKRTAIQDVKDYIRKEFGLFEPDWEDNSERRYTIYCDGKNFRFEYYYIIKNYSPIGYLRTGEDCIKLIKDKEKELKIIWEV